MTSSLNINLDEVYIPVKNDKTLRRRTKYILICQLNSLVPTQFSAEIEPRIVNTPISSFTFTAVNRFFAYNALSDHNMMPFHYYTELVASNYVTMVGMPFTSRSWLLDRLCDDRLLPEDYRDSILICLQENYSLMPLENQCMEHLANFVVTPLMRENGFSYDRVKFLEREIDRDMLSGSKYYNGIKEPIFLNETVFRNWLKKFYKGV